MNIRVAETLDRARVHGQGAAGRPRARIGVFASAPPGSLGDQAMLEVVREQVAAGGRYSLSFMLGRTWPRYTLAEPHDVRRYLLTDLPFVQRLQADYLSARFSSLWAIGADIVDGSYGGDLPVRILSLLRHAGERGRSVGVFGCSISDSPQPAPMRILRETPGLRFLTRDPISRERFRQGAGREPELVADIAFLLKPRLTTPAAHRVLQWLRDRKADGARVLAVNCADRLMKTQKGDAMAALRDIFRDWLAESPEWAVMLFSHDYRAFPVGDTVAVSHLHETLRDAFPDRVRLLEPVTHAWEIKALLGEADGVVTARMHAAIAALGAGVAPLCLVYKGKFEGLMQHFGLEGLCVEPQSLAEGRGFAEKLREYERKLPALSAQARDRLPDVLALSRRNFEAL